MIRAILVLLFLVTPIIAQNPVALEELHSNFALKKSRVEFKRELQERINNILGGKLQSSVEKAWISVFKDISLAYWRDSTVLSALARGYESFEQRGIIFRRALMETAFTLYPDKFNNYINEIYSSTTDPMLFAYSVNIRKYQEKDYKIESAIVELEKRFPEYKSDNVLRQLAYDIETSGKKLHEVLPSPEIILGHHFEKNATIIYTFLNKNREFPGLSVIKSPDGSFVRDESGEIFHVRQMGVSVSNLPAYVRGGNTPQGIFSIVGWYVSPTDEIGPTPCVLTRIPFEKPPSTFFHKNNKYKTWHISDYSNLLPESWKDYEPMYQSYFCGKMGRGLIVMHGSVDDLSFYKDKPYYPLTPTKGCLVTKELWDEETGKATESDQAKLFNAFISTGSTNGYLVVVDIIDDERPVRIKDIKKYIKSE
ncbi:MAG: hypothetical protein SCALA702_17370 [Melioribacteraceae bacterium]|nr:MAG: hypothetical protein SCALA702_17370 [Melioribacteraceae bacterium]